MLSHRYVVPPGLLLPFLCFTIFIIQLGLSLSSLPSTKLVQDIICKSHRDLPFASALLPEGDCHDEEVQRELNLVNTGILISVTIGGALVAFPMGLLADSVGRVPILTLSILGLFFSSTYSVIVLWRAEDLPLKAIWGTGAWLLIGGGRSTAEAMVFTIISDVVPEQKRAIWFQCIVAAVIAAQVLGPLLSRELVKHSVWMPLWLSLGSVLLGGIVIALFTPETLPHKPITTLGDHDQAPGTKATLRSLLKKPSVLLLPAATLAVPLASTQLELLTRLMPVQFSWSLSSSTLLLALSSLITLITLLLVLPGISYLLRKKDAAKRDVSLLQGSAYFPIIGSLQFMMLSAPGFVVAGVVIMALGSGTPTLSRALLVSFLPNSKHTGSLFGILAVLEILGFLMCQLGMGALFDAGLGVWLGLPFGTGMALALCVAVMAWMVRVPRAVEDPEDDESTGWEISNRLSSLERY